MDIVADENVDWLLVDWLRLSGHDVLWIAEFARGRHDGPVLADATTKKRVLITSDLDFGEHVFHRHAAAWGVVSLRIRSTTSAQLLTAFQRHWPAIEAKAPGHFIVVRNDRLRIRPL